MIETIADINKRYVWRPLLASYSMPHVEVRIPCKYSYDQGWNACMSHLKAVGKI